MKLKIVFNAALFFIGILHGQAQMISPQTVNSGGNYKTAGNIILEDAIGSLAVTTINTSTFMYTQGFIQPDAGTTSGPLYVNDVILSTSGNGFTNAGTTFTNGTLMLEFTTGEMASITLNNGNNMLTQGILQPYTFTGTLAVTGLSFAAQRKNNALVQLDWSTLTEIDNKGFTIERKKDNESSFTNIGFVFSKANGGNSNFKLDYQKMDDNAYTGKTYYRIKQEDINGQYKYSDIRLVNGINSTTMKVWPIPATGPVNVLVNGFTRPDLLQVVDATGRLVQTFTIQNNQPLQLNKLSAGTYIVRLAENKELMQKIVVQ